MRPRQDLNLLLVGQAPARGRTGQRAFQPDTRSGRFLAELFGVEDVAEVAEPVNLVRRFPGDTPWIKGHHFPLGQAKRAARRLPLSGWDAVILVGRGVAEAFGLEEAPFLVRTEVKGRPALLLPHPSPVNIWWNHPENRRKAKRAVNRFLEKYG